MANRVYSLVLNDEVVDAIDNAALACGSSRSNLINQILADYVSYTTPEKQMQNVFGALQQMVDETPIFRLQPHASNSMLSILSALKYKYHPTIRYCVELGSRSENGGVLKVLFRTQNQALLSLLQNFFSIFAQMENQYAHTRWQFADGKFERRFKPSSPVSAEMLGQAIGYYIRHLDATIKDYFNESNNAERALSTVAQHIKHYYQPQNSYMTL